MPKPAIYGARSCGKITHNPPARNNALRPTVFIHTNHKQMLGAIMSRYSLQKRSAHADRFDVRFIEVFHRGWDMHTQLPKRIQVQAKDVDQAQAALVRYTGREEKSATAWVKWLKANRDYLFFTDCEGFRFKVDEEAKRKGVPTKKLRGWSSEEVDYRPDHG